VCGEQRCGGDACRVIQRTGDVRVDWLGRKRPDPPKNPRAKRIYYALGYPLHDLKGSLGRERGPSRVEDDDLVQRLSERPNRRRHLDQEIDRRANESRAVDAVKNVPRRRGGAGLAEQALAGKIIAP
jgi:hypothetical protein